MGTHTESGPYSAEEWLRIYAEHLEIHARQIDANVAAWRKAHPKGAGRNSRRARPSRRPRKGSTRNGPSESDEPTHVFLRAHARTLSARLAAEAQQHKL